MNALVEDIKKLPVVERIELVEEIWNSIPQCSLELSAEECAELHRRYAAHQAHPSTAITWEEVRSKMLSTSQR